MLSSLIRVFESPQSMINHSFCNKTNALLDSISPHHLNLIKAVNGRKLFKHGRFNAVQ